MYSKVSKQKTISKNCSPNLFHKLTFSVAGVIDTIQIILDTIEEVGPTNQIKSMII